MDKVFNILSWLTILIEILIPMAMIWIYVETIIGAYHLFGIVAAIVSAVLPGVSTLMWAIYVWFMQGMFMNGFMMLAILALALCVARGVWHWGVSRGFVLLIRLMMPRSQ